MAAPRIRRIDETTRKNDFSEDMESVVVSRHIGIQGGPVNAGSSPKRGSDFFIDDRTPKPSRAASPHTISMSPGGELAIDGINPSQRGEESSEPPSIRIQRTTSSDFYDTLLSPLSGHPPSRSPTPKSRPLSPAADDMPSSSQLPGPSNQARQSGTRRQQTQQTQQPDRQIYNSAPLPQPPQQQYYSGPSPSSDSSYRSPSSISSAGTPSYSHPPSQQQRTPGYVGQYTIPTPASSSVFAHQHQPAFAYPPPPLHIAGIHSHGHSTPEFFNHRQSPVYPSPPFGPPRVHTSVQPDQSPGPALSYDYDSGQTRSPTSNAPFTPPQHFPAFSFHPALTTTPQFTHSHSSYPSPFPPQQPQFRQQYTYMATTPSTPDDVAAQGPVSWWYMPPPSTSQSAGPYQNMYFVDAYGNRPSVGMGLGQGFPASSSRSSPQGGIQPPAFVAQDTGQGTLRYPAFETGSAKASESGSDIGIGQFAEPSRGPSVPTAPAAHPESSDRATQPLSTAKSASHGQRRPYRPLAHRSEWVMWVGNVPSDATHDELWRFFNRPILSPRQVQPMPPALLPAGLLSPSGSSSASSTSPGDASIGNGVASIFLIARSNCAFVNYISEAHLLAAVAHFNGIQLRPGDPRCPRLVCRVRGKDEDQRAGVGGQRGMGMHVRWIREQKEREQARERERKDKEVDDPPQTPSSASQAESAPSAAESFESNRSLPRHSSSSSTTSSFFTRYYPKRYFILKSLTQYDLDLSVERGVWATQPHNETVLDKAFRTSSDVFLIFGVNKSGEFYGYARMEGPIGKTDEQVSWASRDSQHSRSPTTSFSSGAGRSSQISETIPEEKEGDLADDAPEGDRKPPLMFSPSEHRLAEDSPKPLTPGDHRAPILGKGKASDPNALSGAVREHSQAEDTRIDLHARPRPPKPHKDPISAPPELGRPHRRITDPSTSGVPASAGTADTIQTRQPPIQLNPEAPLKAVREQQARGPNSDPPVEDENRVLRRDTHQPRETVHDHPPSIPGSVLDRLKDSEFSMSRSAPSRGRPVQDSLSATVPQSDPSRDGVPPQWGTTFKVRWIRVAKLPFHRTRHLRNPWNHEREVKVSRDGTELEPTAGQALLDEWDKLDQAPSQPGPSTAEAPSGTSISPTVGRRGGHFRRTQSQSGSQILDQKT